MNEGGVGYLEQRVGWRSVDLWNHTQWRCTVDKELKVALECQAVRRGWFGKWMALDMLTFS